MLNLYTSVVTKTLSEDKFSKGEKLSIIYHNLFDYALSLGDLIRWRANDGINNIDSDTQIFHKNGHFFLEGKESLIYQRLLRKRISAKKLEIAKKAAKVISFLPSIKMVGVTGSLAMENSTEESDIDLMIVTSEKNLWTSRFLVYFLLRLVGFNLRKPFEKAEKDKLCLNIWLDEGNLVWRERNLYTAHEIAQIVILINKDNTYERLLSKNRWILNFWPNSVKISKSKVIKSKLSLGIVESIAFWTQYSYMKSKITREVVTKTRALFHPQDWSSFVLGNLRKL
jgi:predicted nucleotidyltransferase